MTSEDLTDNVLVDWDLREQEARTKFLDYLYDFFGCTDGLYTGLWSIYKEGIALAFRDEILHGNIELKEYKA
jgi:hypothetical protein